MLDQATQRRFIDHVLHQAYPVMYAQLHPELRTDILNSVLSGEDVLEKFVGAPADSAALNFMEWVEIVSVGATLVSMGLQVYQLCLDKGKSKRDAQQEACDALQRHEATTRVQTAYVAAVVRELQRALEQEP
jgi:hypothetical protein